jgi:DNA polymerase-3 subunit epsilon
VHGTAATCHFKTADATAYAALLDRILEDRLVADVEAESLVTLAREWGLDGQQVATTHRQYLVAIAAAAWADGVITESERADLMTVTNLLGFDDQTLDAVLSEVAANAAPLIPMIPISGTQHELVGKRVCFTGDHVASRNGIPMDRETAERLAAEAGMEVLPRVTKKLDVLVLADPHSMSQKAQTARRYGTRIMAEPVFWRLVGVEID